MKFMISLVGSFSIVVQRRLIASTTGSCFFIFLAGLVGTNSLLLFPLPDSFSKFVSIDELASTCADGSNASSGRQESLVFTNEYNWLNDGP